MNLSKANKILLACLILLVLACCKKSPSGGSGNVANKDPNYDYGTYDSTSYTIDYPDYVPNPLLKEDNPMTIKGVTLGKKLFFDPILSADSSVSCVQCHLPSNAFANTEKVFSNVFKEQTLTRNTLPLFNMAWTTAFAWDGRKNDLEEKIHGSVINPFGNNGNWEVIEARMDSHPTYRKEFYEAFETYEIKQEHIQKAMGQYIRSLTSFDSKFDNYLTGQTTLTDQELIGFQIFTTEKGDCFHCHSHSVGLFHNNAFENNGLDSLMNVSDFEDIGLAIATNSDFDKGKFKAPSLRNIGFTAPYMHDGRMTTLDEVIDHYNNGGKYSPTVSPTMKYVGEGLGLTEDEKAALKAFLLTLNDSSFVSDTIHNSPF